MPVGTIVAIGGGDIAARPLPETWKIDSWIANAAQENLRHVGEDRPVRVLFVPTASGDYQRLLVDFDRVYGGMLKCEVDFLVLTRKDAENTLAGIAAQISKADVIYVGGGNTMRMMEIWRECGVDEMLREAYRNGKILCGMSAGAICWFKQGHSDSLRYGDPEAPASITRPDKPYIFAKGLSLANGSVCPHFNDAERQKDLLDRIREANGHLSIIGIDDGAALIVLPDGTMKAISSQTGKWVYECSWSRTGGIVRKSLK